MDSSLEIVVQAPRARVFALAAGVERWPALLPHYRSVVVRERQDSRKLVDMAASRDGIPVSWRAVQTLFPDEYRITFQHVRGATRGMDVAWELYDTGAGTRVQLTHHLTLCWPLIGRRLNDWIATRIIGHFFVEYIAGKTLRRLKALAEGGEGGG
jgi:ribosome-associated toxin RatA of RatAB toxin-antitoxin module